MLVAERAHDGVVGLADLLAATRGRGRGEQRGRQRPGAQRDAPGIPEPYLTWLELNTVIPATNTRSPAAAAMPSRNVYQPSQAKYRATFSPKYHLRGQRGPRDAHSPKGYPTGCSQPQG